MEKELNLTDEFIIPHITKTNKFSFITRQSISFFDEVCNSRHKITTYKLFNLIQIYKSVGIYMPNIS